MQGNYSIGGDGADFDDLDNAITALHAASITGNVYLYLNPGTYTGPYIIENLDMAGYTLYISSGTYSSDEVIFTNHAATSQDNYIILIKNSSNIRIDDFDFAPTGQYSRSIMVSGDSNDISITNNRFFNTSGTNTSNNESVYFQSESANDADNVLIQFNQFFDGSYHVQINSSNYDNNFSNWTIQANVHMGGYHGISLNRGSNLEIYGNTMINTNNGISISSYSGSLLINKNRLYTWVNGLSLDGCDFNAPATPNIYNNIIRANGTNWYSSSGSANAYGLSVLNSKDVYAAHNSIELSSSASGSVVATIVGTRNIFRKNHFVNLDGGYSLNFINTEPDVTNRNLVEYNNIYASGTYLGKRSNTSYKEMSEMIPLFDSYNADLNPFFEDEYLRSNAPRLNNLDPLLAPMEGDYTIGVGGDYPTVSDFAVALAFRGINNPITADLSETNYNEQVNFDRIPGSGHDRVITIRKSPFIGTGNATTISYSAQTAMIIMY